MQKHSFYVKIWSLLKLHVFCVIIRCSVIFNIKNGINVLCRINYEIFLQCSAKTANQFIE